jgi:hypothetical protein
MHSGIAPIFTQKHAMHFGFATITNGPLCLQTARYTYSQAVNTEVKNNIIIATTKLVSS